MNQNLTCSELPWRP